MAKMTQTIDIACSWRDHATSHAWSLHVRDVEVTLSEWCWAVIARLREGCQEVTLPVLAAWCWGGHCQTGRRLPGGHTTCVGSVMLRRSLPDCEKAARRLCLLCSHSLLCCSQYTLSTSLLVCNVTVHLKVPFHKKINININEHT